MITINSNYEQKRHELIEIDVMIVNVARAIRRVPMTGW